MKLTDFVKRIKAIEINDQGHIVAFKGECRAKDFKRSKNELF